MFSAINSMLTAFNYMHTHKLRQNISYFVRYLLWFVIIAITTAAAAATAAAIVVVIRLPLRKCCISFELENNVFDLYTYTHRDTHTLISTYCTGALQQHDDDGKQFELRSFCLQWYVCDFQLNSKTPSSL